MKHQWYDGALLRLLQRQSSFWQVCLHSANIIVANQLQSSRFGSSDEEAWNVKTALQDER